MGDDIPGIKCEITFQDEHKGYRGASFKNIVRVPLIAPQGAYAQKWKCHMVFFSPHFLFIFSKPYQDKLETKHFSCLP